MLIVQLSASLLKIELFLHHVIALYDFVRTVRCIDSVNTVLGTPLKSHNVVYISSAFSTFTEFLTPRKKNKKSARESHGTFTQG